MPDSVSFPLEPRLPPLHQQTSESPQTMTTSNPQRPNPTAAAATFWRRKAAAMLPILTAGALLGLSCTATKPPCQSPGARGEEKIVATHVMGCMGVGNGRVPPGESILGILPNRPDGLMALPVPEYMANYGQPLAAAKQDLAVMKAAGINTLSLMVSGHLLTSQFSAMNHAYLQAAVEDGSLRVCPDVWGDLSQPRTLTLLADELALIKEKYAAAWLRRDGRLAVSVQGLADGNSELAERLFAKIGGRQAVYLIGYGQRQNTDACTAWLHQSYAVNVANLAEAMAASRQSGVPLWHPVMPSFTQSRNWGRVTPNVREQLGMCWFRRAWLMAIEAGAPAVLVETWNDLSEDSALMPESNHDWAYHELNKHYAAWFKTGKEPAVTEEKVLLFHHPQVVEGVKLPAGVKPMEGFPVSHGNTFDQRHGTPPTDYVGVVAMLKAPAKVTVMLGETVLGEQEFPAGVTSWLLYQPRPRNDPRKLYPCDPAAVYPRAEPGLLVTELEQPFGDAEVHLAVARAGGRIGFFRSHRPIAAAAGKGELTTVGDVFRLAQSPCLLQP